MIPSPSYLRVSSAGLIRPDLCWGDKVRKTTWMVGMTALALSGFAACGGDSDPVNPGPPPPPPPPPAITLTLSPDSVVVMANDTAVVVANWVRPAGVTSPVNVTIRDVVGGVIATVEPAGTSSTDITLVTAFSATLASRWLQVTASGQGMTADSDSILIRVLDPVP